MTRNTSNTCATSIGLSTEVRAAVASDLYVPLENVEMFIDDQTIESGEEWELSISENLSRAQAALDNLTRRRTSRRRRAAKDIRVHPTPRRAPHQDRHHPRALAKAAI